MGRGTQGRASRRRDPRMKKRQPGTKPDLPTANTKAHTTRIRNRTGNPRRIPPGGKPNSSSSGASRDVNKAAAEVHEDPVSPRAPTHNKEAPQTHRVKALMTCVSNPNATGARFESPRQRPPKRRWDRGWEVTRAGISHSADPVITTMTA